MGKYLAAFMASGLFSSSFVDAFVMDSRSSRNNTDGW